MANGGQNQNPWPRMSGGATFNSAVSVPLGYRFCPTDDELLSIYLKKKTLHQPLPIRIREVHVYGHTPQQLTEMYKGDNMEDAWYFFTKRGKKSEKATRPNRIITGNNGYWKASGSEVDVNDDDGKLVGGKRALVYYGGGKGKAAKKTDWLMKEYTMDKLVKASGGETKLNGWVLCKIHNNKLEMPKRQSEKNCDETNTKRLKKGKGIYINETGFEISNEYKPGFQRAPQLQQSLPYNYDGTTNYAGTTTTSTSSGDGQNWAMYNEYKSHFQHVPHECQEHFPSNYNSTANNAYCTTSWGDAKNLAIPNGWESNFQCAPQFQQLPLCYYDSTTGNASGTTSCPQEHDRMLDRRFPLKGDGPDLP